MSVIPFDFFDDYQIICLSKGRTVYLEPRPVYQLQTTSPVLQWNRNKILSEISTNEVLICLKQTSAIKEPH